MRNKTSLLAFLLLFCSMAVFAQEAIFELGGNPVLMDAWEKREARKENGSGKSRATLTLPFFEDFSYNGPFADSSKWTDEYVYINYTFAKAPPSLGVATFDGLARNGLPYDWGVSPGSSSPADTLTSQPIDLSAVPATDTSLYFSFFYQPQGRGNAPEAADSLVLEFREQGGAWAHIWAKAGYAPAINDSSFHFVLIQVPSQFYFSSFQFRFRNRATLSGNVDHWHIDYVYLAKNRSKTEKGAMRDYAFVYPAPSLLKNYHTMPYRQYTKSELKDNFRITIKNNFPAPQSIKYYNKITDITNNMVLDEYVGGTEIVPAQSYDNSPVHTTPAIDKALFPESLSDSTVFEAVHSLDTIQSLSSRNDTTRFRQNFFNYFAYDDGTAELAYGIQSAFAMVAYKFTLNVPDTLRAVSIFWNPFLKNMESKSIRITVWNDIGGRPGQVVYQDSVKTPKYVAGHNNFHYYMIDDKEVTLNGTFYVGWVQVEAETLNVGLDMNNNAQSKIFYNTNGNWNNTAFRGALMVRPYFGSVFVPVSIPDEEKPEKKKREPFTVYPNPAQDVIFVRNLSGDSSPNARVNIFDAYGRLVVSSHPAGNIDVSALASGLYIVSVSDGEGSVSSHRLIISR